MPTLKPTVPFIRFVTKASRHWREAGLGLLLPLAFLLTSGCKKDTAATASDSDVNGYLCSGCNAKLFSDRTVFLEPKCPKCQQDKLLRVIGYWCEKDKHMTIGPERGDRTNVPTCERCQTNLQNAIHLPRENDLTAWGATKAP